ncbi:hypothetical protein AJ80_05089 [Polytolypa hystricis UAMH7299]|uniref:DNA polymerase eta n=1 Tax=Polytolypa hystricis (strain UAMH7299) TaxID=1447883 RepID=A0A2B7XYA4_POLH7|nr:hypothetical protein AJ80_05089 [Polytolypa hystricis UAMH7299]
MSSPSRDDAFFLRAHSRPTSCFTYRNLHQLRTYTPRNPLRVIAHIDLDAFYAQCEMVRLSTPRDIPLAVQQWDSLIAVNYAARPFGVSRMITAKDAKARCPTLQTPHVATFREGEGGKWTYRDHSEVNIQTDKVSLDPYRAESKKIMAAMKEALRGWAEYMDQRGCGEKGAHGVREEYEHLVRVEKGGIDEVFVDLSALVFVTLMQRYPMLQEMEEKKELSEKLPVPPTTVLEWAAEDSLVDLDAGEVEEDDPDWDDVVMLIGAEIVRSVRQAVWEQLKYTCSGGIARNKMLAKLGSACNKPNKQTIVRNRAVQQFLGGFSFTKIRMLGGKLGKQVATIWDTDQVSELLHVPLVQLKAKLNDDTGTWLYEVIRGNDYSEVNTGTQIKSMLSAKSFRPSINSEAQAERWLRIFAADIYGRLVEEGVLEHKRRPTVISLHHRTSGQTKSRQVPIPTGKTIDEALLYDLSKALLSQVLNGGRIWPCANLSLTVSGFEDGLVGNQSLFGFFSQGAHGDISSKPPLSWTHSPTDREQAGELEPVKRRKIGHSSSINGFFAESFNPHDDETDNAETLPPYELDEAFTCPTYTCPRCEKAVPETERTEHEDWHFAKDLDSQQRRATIIKSTQASTTKGRRKVEKGQTRLAFG